MNHSHFSFAALSDEQKEKFNEARNIGWATKHNERFAHLLGLQAISRIVRAQIIELDAMVNEETIFFTTLLQLEMEAETGGLPMTETARVTLEIRKKMDRRYEQSQK